MSAMFKSATHIGCVACVIELYGAIFFPDNCGNLFNRSPFPNHNIQRMGWNGVECGDDHHHHHHIVDECAWHFPAFERNVSNHIICEHVCV